mmetsp:Transcript_9528/g.17045  ORF Transcript_9528/g.17045 Transcript_9528/m.17045 type:complete len:225 (+) Transcript_9528:377-1051(+)
MFIGCGTMLTPTSKLPKQQCITVETLCVFMENSNPVLGYRIAACKGYNYSTVSIIIAMLLDFNVVLAVNRCGGRCMSRLFDWRRSRMVLIAVSTALRTVLLANMLSISTAFALAIFKNPMAILPVITPVTKIVIILAVTVSWKRCWFVCRIRIVDRFVGWFGRWCGSIVAISTTFWTILLSHMFMVPLIVTITVVIYPIAVLLRVTIESITVIVVAVLMMWTSR